MTVIGPESTGGRLVARLLRADPGLTVEHWSMPHGGGDPDTAGFTERHWPTDHLAQPDRVVVTVRSAGPMLASKIATHEPDPHFADQEAQDALRRILVWVRCPYRLVPYEALTQAPGAVMGDLWAWLGRPSRSLTEDVRDGNTKWWNSEP